MRHNISIETKFGPNPVAKRFILFKHETLGDVFLQTSYKKYRQNLTSILYITHSCCTAAIVYHAVVVPT